MTFAGKKGEAGFTLLELLMALMLSMLVLVIVADAIKLGAGSLRSGQRRADSDCRLASVSNILDSQIQAMVVLSKRKNRDFTFRGDSSSMEFPSVYSIWGDRRGLVWVKYTVSSRPDGKEALDAEETIVGTSMRKETVLLPRAGSVGFRYFIRDLKGENGEWVDRLKARRLRTKVLKVGVNFVWEGRKVRMIIPVNVRDSLNKTEEEVQGGVMSAGVPAGPRGSTQTIQPAQPGQSANHTFGPPAAHRPPGL